MSECWNDERCKYPEEIGMSVCSDCKNRIIYELEKQNEDLIKLLKLDQPWPLVLILEKLIWATNHLLDNKNYDGHGHEELNLCMNLAKEIQNQLEQKPIEEITIVKTSSMGPTVSGKMQGTACIKIDGKIERHWCECFDCLKCPYIK